MIGISRAIPAALRAKPVRMMRAGRSFPARLPTSIAKMNIVSDRGASESPACIASYSRRICRKIGSAIIAPPSVIC